MATLEDAVAYPELDKHIKVNCTQHPTNPQEILVSFTDLSPWGRQFLLKDQQ